VEGRIYIATVRGIDCYDPASGLISQLSAGAGPPPGETHVLYRDRSGAIWFGSSSGLTRYAPQRDPPGPPPQPAIREVRISGLPVMASDEGEAAVRLRPLQAGAGSIEIGFGSVDFAIENRTRYRYRLKPAEKDWREPSSRRTVAGRDPGSA